ncbi:HGxxPAAW family protein [Streptomyces sp. NPDC050560]|uniref:HGxxPAAW family protein n=1 Tax=Streptomyces sp. NPDC050560 TaxID=3365630 RepID=UPI0037927F37
MSSTSHGHTPAAWAGVIIAFIGFCAAGAFMVMDSPVGFWVGIGLILLGAIVGGILRMAGFGKTKRSSTPRQVASQS